MLATGALGLAGCLADPPPPPEVVPLEIIATTSVRPDEDCLLNVSEVGAGPHQVYVFTDQAPADVRVLDPAGAVVLDVHAEPHDHAADMPEEPGLHEVPPTPVLRMEAGTYRIECLPEGQPMSVTELRVVPARPGFEDMQPDG